MTDACLLKAREFLDGSNEFDDILSQAQEEAMLRAGDDPDIASNLLPGILNELIEDLGTKEARNAKQLFHQLNAQSAFLSRVGDFVRAGKNPVKAFKEVLWSVFNASDIAGHNAIISFNSQLQAEALVPYIKDKKNHVNIAKEIAELNKTKGKRGITGDKQAQKLAEIYETHVQSARGTMLKLGVPVANLEGRIVRQVFSPEALVGKRSEFISDMLPRIDRYRTFNRQNVNDSEVKKFLEDYYDDVIGGKIADFQPKTVDLEKTKKTYSRKQSDHRVMHLSTAEDIRHSIDKYTGDSFYDVLNNTVRTLHTNAALIQEMGANTRLSFDTVRQEAKVFARNDVDRASLESVGEDIFTTGTRDYYDKGYSPVWANASVASRALTSAVFLGKAALSAVGDFGTSMVSAARIGSPALGHLGKFMEQSFDSLKSLPNDERLAILAGAEVQSAHMIGSFAEMTSGTTRSGGIAKGSLYLANLNMTLSGLHWITQKNKIAAALNFKTQAYAFKNKSFGELNKGMRFALMRGGINEAQWNVLRDNADALSRDYGRHKFMDAYLIDSLPDSAFVGVTPTGTSLNASQIALAKSDLKTKLLAAVGGFADDAVPTGGVRERNILRLGTMPGTPGGFITAQMTSLLSYPVSWTTRVLERTLEADNPVGGIAGLMATALVFGAISDFLVQTANGRSRDYDAILEGGQPTTDFLTSAVTRGGFGGIYASVALDYMMYNQGFSSLTAGAPLGLADKVATNFRNIITNAATGDTDAAIFSTLETFKTLPLSGLPYVSMPFDAMVYYPLMEMYAPDKLNRIERNFKQRTGGEFFITP